MSLPMSTVHVFYRLANQPAAQPKVKLPDATKTACLRNCVDVFGGGRVTVFGDRLDDGLAETARGLVGRFVAVDEGSGGGTFRRAADAAMGLPADAVVYLVEDDFLHLPRSAAAILDGLAVGAAYGAPYVALYDHPDKYVARKAGGNPHVKHGGEATRLLCGKVCHWKGTNSTVMTFATTAGQLRRDWRTFLKFCGGRYTDDYRLFRSLAWRGRRVVSAVPGLATHCESAYLSPFTDWVAVARAAGGEAVASGPASPRAASA